MPFETSTETRSGPSRPPTPVPVGEQRAGGPSPSGGAGPACASLSDVEPPGWDMMPFGGAAPVCGALSQQPWEPHPGTDVKVRAPGNTPLRVYGPTLSPTPGSSDLAPARPRLPRTPPVESSLAARGRGTESAARSLLGVHT